MTCPTIPKEKSPVTGGENIPPEEEKYEEDEEAMGGVVEEIMET